MPPTPIMAPVHKYAIYEFNDAVELAPTDKPMPSPASLASGAMEIHPADLVRLMNQLSSSGALGPVYVLGEGLFLIGELAGFAMIETGSGIIPGVFGPRV